MSLKLQQQQQQFAGGARSTGPCTSYGAPGSNSKAPLSVVLSGFFSSISACPPSDRVHKQTSDGVRWRGLHIMSNSTFVLRVKQSILKTFKGATDNLL